MWIEGPNGGGGGGGGGGGERLPRLGGRNPRKHIRQITELNSYLLHELKDMEAIDLDSRPIVEDGDRNRSMFFYSFLLIMLNTW